VIVNEGGTPTVLAAKKATATIPIVFHASNAITDGIVDNLAQPGGNLTGTSQFSTETLIKGFQFLTELAPQATRITLLSVGLAPAVAQRAVQEIQASNAAGKVAIGLLPAPSDSELDAAYATLARSARPSSSPPFRPPPTGSWHWRPGIASPPSTTSAPLSSPEAC
jgi:putative ABC transport system substrate-binding protein